MTRLSLSLLAPAAFIMLDACGPEQSASEMEAPEPPAAEETGEDHTEAPGDEPSDSDTSGETETSGTAGGDGSDITLLPVTGTEMPDLNGELGCSFTTGQGETLLVARANVGDDATPQAGVNNNGYGERLASPQAGGFSALETDGAKFGGRGLTVTVSTDERQDGDDTETVRHTASMLVQRGDGAERTYEGDWVCGP